jgi:hypothetical protein
MSCLGQVFSILTLILLMWRIGWAPSSIPIYIQQDATLHSLFISGNCSTCFGWYFHTSSGAHTTVSIASGTCHTVTAICRYRGRVETGLSLLWVAYTTHSVGTHFQHSHDTSRQRHTCLIPETVIQFRCSWWWTKILLERCRATKE